MRSMRFGQTYYFRLILNLYVSAKFLKNKSVGVKKMSSFIIMKMTNDIVFAQSQ